VGGMVVVWWAVWVVGVGAACVGHVVHGGGMVGSWSGKQK